MFIPVNCYGINFFLYALICPDFLAISTFSSQCDFITSESSAQSSGLYRSLAAWKMTPCATKNTEYQMESSLFLFSFSRVCLFFYFFFTPLLSCYSVFEHVSGKYLISDWNRCCAWIVVALFCCDCSRTC